MKQDVIAIDGPAGAGKSTVAKKVAEKLGFLYIDTGAMYRAVTLQVLDRATETSDEAGISKLAEHVAVRFTQEADAYRVWADGVDVTAKIRSPEVTAAVAKVSQVPAVRAAMVRLQRDMAREGAVVLDGRDIGTVVLPDACCKIFLTASVKERALRRWKELREKGYEQSFDALQREIALRDKEDMERTFSPLVQASDAMQIDTTDLSIDDAVTKIVEIYRSRCKNV
jgi:cytidylate kinase